MNILEKKRLLKIAEEAAGAAGDFLARSNPKITRNWEKDIKLNEDKKAHKIIERLLTKHTAAPVFSEEGNRKTPLKGIYWIVDPLDGSLNYSRKIPICVVSIALMVGEDPVLGVIYDFNRRETFSGVIGVGAWLNGKRMSVSKTKHIKNAVLATGFPSETSYKSSDLIKYLKSIQSFKKVRLFGSAALSLAYLANGRVDSYYEKSIRIWDVYAGLALVKAAGGQYKIKKEDESHLEVYASNSSLK